MTPKYLHRDTLGIIISPKYKQGLSYLIELGLKHSKYDFVPLYNNECSIEKECQTLSNCCMPAEEILIRHISSA